MATRKSAAQLTLLEELPISPSKPSNASKTASPAPASRTSGLAAIAALAVKNAKAGKTAPSPSPVLRPVPVVPAVEGSIPSAPAKRRSKAVTLPADVTTSPTPAAKVEAEPPAPPVKAAGVKRATTAKKAARIALPEEIPPKAPVTAAEKPKRAPKAKRAAVAVTAAPEGSVSAAPAPVKRIAKPAAPATAPPPPVATPVPAAKAAKTEPRKAAPRKAEAAPKKAASRAPSVTTPTVPVPALPHPFRGYRVTHEDGCEAEVRASVGCFYPFDPETVAFYCRDLSLARKVCRKWRNDVRIYVEGDEETTLHLPFKLYPEVASLIGVSRRAA